MIGEYRFFQDYFDGQIIGKESDKFKMFKLILFSSFSAIGLFLVLMEICNPAEYILLELGMIWNLYLGLGKKFSIVLSVLVSFLYFFFCSNFGLYANGLIYLACYIPLQLFATTKDYEDGDFIQIKKTMTDYNKILYVSFFVILTVALCLFDVSVGSRFSLVDGVTAGLLVCSAVLRNERYYEYYVFRIISLISSIALWIIVIAEFGAVGTIAILMMYLSYLIYDVANLFYQNKTYINEYMVQVNLYKKAEDNEIVKEKLELYKISRLASSKNNINKKEL